MSDETLKEQSDEAEGGAAASERSDVKLFNECADQAAKNADIVEKLEEKSILTSDGMDFDQVRAFIEKADRVKELKAELKEATAELGADKAGVLDRFTEAGVGSIRIDGKTVYTHRQLWAGKADFLDSSGNTVKEKGETVKVENDDYIQAIKDAGLDHMVRETVASQTISSWVRELEEGPDGMPVLPPELEKFLKVTEKFDVRVRKS